MNDEPVGEALRERAERGTPRGAQEVYRAAASDARSGEVAPDAGDHGDHGDHGRNRARYALVAGIVALAGLGGALFVIDGGESSTQRLGTDSSAFCPTMGNRVSAEQADVIVYMKPEATDADVAHVRDALALLPGLESIDYVDQDDTWNDFRDLFEGDAAMLENVDPSDLPTSFELEFETFDASVESALRHSLVDLHAVLGHPPYRRRSDLTTLDLVAWAGSRALEQGTEDGSLLVGALIAGRLNGLADNDPALDDRTRNDLRLMSVVVAGSSLHELGVTDAQVAQATERLTRLAATSCGLAPRLRASTTDSGYTTEPATEPTGPGTDPDHGDPGTSGDPATTGPATATEPD